MTGPAADGAPPCSSTPPSRGVLLPAAMTLLGDRNWCLPRWLTWLPTLRLDAPAPGQPARVRHPSLSSMHSQPDRWPGAYGGSCR